MSSTTFVAGTIIPSAWLNDVNNLVYNGVIIAAGLTVPILTATTKVVTPIVDSGSGSLIFKGAGTTALTITGANVVFAGTIASGQITANLTGNVTGNVSGTAATVTTAAQPAITSVGTLTSIATTGLVDISASTAGQIKFPSTQNASSDVNTLDQYQEGTWTPSVGGTATYLTQEASYVKIGKTVFIWMLLHINAIGTGSTTVISGLPFAADGFANYIMAVGTFSNAATSIVFINGVILATLQTIRLDSMTAAGTQTTSNPIFGANTTICLSGSYQTTN